MTKEEIKEKKRKVEDELTKEKKKQKKDKKHKDKKEKKDSKDKTEKSEKKDKKEKKVKEGSKKEESGEKAKAEYTVPSASGPEVEAFYKENEVSVDYPVEKHIQPVLSFDELSLDSRIQKVLSVFPKPTPIQSVSWPYLLSGKDVIGVAETGSGKTFAFGVPAINKLVTEDGSKKGVQVLAISPTRELASQIYDNLVLLTEKANLECCCVYGGVPKYEQREQLKKAQVVVATPGRLLDLLQEGSVDLSNVTYLVLDEADRMLEKGFEEDIKNIINATNTSGRQTLMFTATWPKEVRELASTFMSDPVKVSIGNRDELSANKRITQIVEVIDQFQKERKILELLKKYHSKDEKVLIFALYKKEAARVERNLKYNGYSVAAIHGDLSQQQRTQALNEFKTGQSNLLLATDVAARGLDIPNVKTVINLTFPLTVEDYVHRIGRTGRAGQTGTAHTLFTEQEKHLAGALVNVLNGANQPVPEELKKFGTHTKKKEHSAYGAFYKDVDMNKKPKKTTFD